MASKFKPGLPDSFTLDVQPVADLGDYLDERPPTLRPQPRVTTPSQAEPVKQPAPEAKQFVQPPPVAPVEPARIDTTPANAEVPRREEVVATPVAPQQVVTQPTPSEIAREKRALYPRMPRREISMTPETLTMSDELLEMIRSGSGQQDTKANELFHALVLLVHEVKDEIDLYSIPKRGKWGTPTARAYPIEIKNAFLHALLHRGMNQS